MKKLSPIIPVSSPCCQAHSWKKELKRALSDAHQLLQYVGVDAGAFEQGFGGQKQFPLRVPRPFADRMKYGDPRDPLLRQVLSLDQEMLRVKGYNRDPLQEQANRHPGLLHKYHGRVLLILAAACAVNCRYCFRRHFPYQEQASLGSTLAVNLQAIASDPSISEVILSGGDPLMQDDPQLTKLLASLERIPHIKRLRVHTRLPVVIPARVTDELCQLLEHCRFAVTLVLHINHAQEIDAALNASLNKLRKANVHLLNQAVLLRGVNDDATLLCQLSERAFEVGILPYYLHLLDPIAGAAHFDVGEDRAKSLVQTMRRLLPGYLVPRLAREWPDRPSKTIIS